MSILRWDPMEEFEALREKMDRMMEQGLSPLRMIGGGGVMRLPLDAYTTEEEIIITAGVPGLKPEDVEITLEGDVLTIEGTLPEPLENVDYLFRERPRGKFRRSLTINVPIKPEEAEATFDRGVLRLIMPKAEEAKPKVIRIKPE